MITFQANLSCTNTVKKINHNKQNLENVNVNFVSLNPLESNDALALKQTCHRCWNNANIANRINYNFQNFKSNKNCDNIEFFALTEQSQNFNKLNPQKILGITQISKLSSNDVFIDLLQTSPEHNYYASNALYKKIGKCIVNSIEKLFPDKDIFVCPATLDSEIFFLKVGFRPFLGDGILRLKHK